MEKLKNLGQLRKLEEGEALMEAKCSVCKWVGKEIFTIGDEDRDMACMNLEDLHEASGCKGVIGFNESQSN